MSKPKPTDPREAKFVAALLRGLSKKDAAIQAGYSVLGAGPQATKLLERPTVKAALADFYQREAYQTKLDREILRRELMALATAPRREAFDEAWKLKSQAQMPTEVAECLVSVRVWDSPEQGSGSAVKLVSKVDAIAKYLKLFPDVVDQAEGLEDAAAEVEAEMEELIARFEAD